MLRFRTFALVILSLLSCVASAHAQEQEPEPTPAQFARLRVQGTSELFVYDGSSSEPTNGYLLRLTERDVTLLVNNREQTIPFSSIRRIDRRGDSLWNGGLIGAAVGIFTWIRLARDFGVPPDGALWIVGMPTMIGIGIDALWQGETTVYKAGMMSPPVRASAARRGGNRAGVLWTWRF